MQVGDQRPPVADCYHRRSYLFMLSHFQISDMSLIHICIIWILEVVWMKYKILVVDDDKELLKMLCSYFNMKQ